MTCTVRSSAICETAISRRSILSARFPIRRTRGCRRERRSAERSRRTRLFTTSPMKARWRQETGFSSIGANNFGLVPFDTTQVGQPFGTVLLTRQQIGFLTNPAVLQQEFLNPLFGQEVGQYTALAASSSGMALKGAWPATLGGFSGFPTSCPPPTPNLLCAGFVRAAEQPGRQLSGLGAHRSLLASPGPQPDQQQPADAAGRRESQRPDRHSGAGAGSAEFRAEFLFADFAAELSRLEHCRAGPRGPSATNKINELRFQYARRGLLYDFSRAAGGSNVAVNIPGFAFFGREPFSFVHRTEQRYQFTDNFTWSKGSHNYQVWRGRQLHPDRGQFHGELWR